MWSKAEEYDFESELNNDQDYQEWSEQLRQESEKQQAEEMRNESTE